MYALRFIYMAGRNFILQIYVVYDKNKKVIAGLAGAILMATVATLVLWVFYFPTGEAIQYPYSTTTIFITQSGKGSPPIYTLTGCYAANKPKLLFLSLVPAIVIEAILCICMLYKGWKIYINDYGSPILKLLIRDRLVHLYFD